MKLRNDIPKVKKSKIDHPRHREDIRVFRNVRKLRSGDLKKKKKD